MTFISSFSLFEFSKAGEINNFPEKGLCTRVWNQQGSNWALHPEVERKVLRIIQKISSNLNSLLGDKQIDDVQITGDLANFGSENSPDMDIHLVIDLSNLDDSEIDSFRKQIADIKFNQDLRSPFKVRGYNIDFHLKAKGDPHDDSGLYSLYKKKWLRPPSSVGLIDDRDISLKLESIVHAIERIEAKSSVQSLTEDSRENLLKGCYYLKKRIQKMRPSVQLKSDRSRFVSNLVYEKLKKEGYIDKLVKNIGSLSKSHREQN